MKLIIEITEVTGNGTTALPGLMQDGALNIKSSLEIESFKLRDGKRQTRAAEHYSDTMLRFRALERHITSAAAEFYKANGLTDNTPCRYPLEPLD